MYGWPTRSKLCWNMLPPLSPCPLYTNVFCLSWGRRISGLKGQMSKKTTYQQCWTAWFPHIPKTVVVQSNLVSLILLFCSHWLFVNARQCDFSMFTTAIFALVINRLTVNLYDSMIHSCVYLWLYGLLFHSHCTLNALVLDADWWCSVETDRLSALCSVCANSYKTKNRWNAPTTTATTDLCFTCPVSIWSSNQLGSHITLSIGFTLDDLERYVKGQWTL